MAGGVSSKNVACYFYGRADNNHTEEPSSVAEEGLVCDGDEDESVYNGANNGEGKGWIVHPDIVVSGHCDCISRLC